MRKNGIVSMINKPLLKDIEQTFEDKEEFIYELVLKKYGIDMELLDTLADIGKTDFLFYELGVYDVLTRLDINEEHAIQLVKSEFTEEQWNDLTEEEKTDLIYHKNYYLSTLIDIDVKLALLSLYYREHKTYIKE